MTLRSPPEWARHDWTWVGFPSNPDEWPGAFEEARADVAGFANALHADGDEPVKLIAADADSAAAARRMVARSIEVSVVPFGDIWLRDTGPIVVTRPGHREARGFRFNGWGGKYVMPGDELVGHELAVEAGLDFTRCDWVLEGGAIDGDGSGLAVTTEQCLTNPNRNPGMTRDEVEARLSADLGLTRILWLGEGIAADHTDGHVDNLARFVGPGLLALPEAFGDHDPNAAVYADARARAEAFGIEIVTIPSPGRIERDGALMAASHMNFVFGNSRVIVPTYGSASADAAIAVLAGLFPEREVVGVDARGIIAGGGSFHCASQQMPALN